MLWISADDRFMAYVNGELVGDHAGTGTFESIDVAHKLKPGRNVLAIMAENMPAAVPANPAGLLASLQIETANAPGMTIRTDRSWRSVKRVANESGWAALDFDDAGWTPAKELGTYGCSPWGTFPVLTSYGPYATGIPDKVRIIYVPEPRPVVVQPFTDAVPFRVRTFDPTNGAMSEGPIARAGNGSTFTVDKPARIKSDDWVIVVDRHK